MTGKRTAALHPKEGHIVKTTDARHYGYSDIIFVF
jgi:hypothetical protein